MVVGGSWRGSAAVVGGSAGGTYMLCGMSAVIGWVGGVVATLLGTWFGAWVTARQAEKDRRRAARDDAERQMRELVVAVGELVAQRRVYTARWRSRQARVTQLLETAMEFSSAWLARGGTWSAAAAVLPDATRTVHAWQRRGLEAEVELMPYLSRVAAAGLPLGLSEDQAVAAAAQRLTDAAVEDSPEEELHQAVRELRAAMGLPTVEEGDLGRA